MHHSWISKIFQTWASHNLLNFYLMMMILYLLESPRCLLQFLFWSILHLKMLYWCKRSWQKVAFVDFWKMTYNVWAHIFEMVHLLILGDEEKLYGIGFSSKWALAGKFLIKYEKVMLGQCLVDFSYINPNLAILNFWWIMSISWGIMINPWSNDGYHFKMLMLTKNLEVLLYMGHIWLLT